MLGNGYGRIVNIASIAGKEGNPNASAYSTSKAAVIGLTKSLGKELAKTKVTVNCVTPAAVRTAIFKQMSQEHIDFMERVSWGHGSAPPGCLRRASRVPFVPLHFVSADNLLVLVESGSIGERVHQIRVTT